MDTNEIKAYLDAEYDKNHLTEDHPAYFASINPFWKYLTVSSILIRSLAGKDLSPDELISWFNQEVKDWDKSFGGDKNRWLELEKEYIKFPDKYPLILFQGEDGYYYLNDGHHRLAIALKHDLLFIPSIVALVEEQ